MSGVFLCFLRSDLVRNQQFRLPIAVNAICFSSLVNKPLGVLTMVYCPSSLVSNVPNQIYLRIDGILLASFRYGKRQLVMTLIIPDIIKLHPIIFKKSLFDKMNNLFRTAPFRSVTALADEKKTP